MRNRWQYLRPICGYLGVLIAVFGLLMLVPLLVRAFFVSSGTEEVPAYAFWLPALGAVALLAKSFDVPFAIPPETS